MSTTTLLALKTLFWRQQGELWTGTATGGSTAKLTDSSLPDMDSDQFPFPFRGKYIRVTSGSASSDLRRIIDGPNASGDLFANRVFSAAVASTNTYEVWGNSINGGVPLTDLFNDTLRVARPGKWTKLVITTDRRWYDITSHVREPDDVRIVAWRQLDTDHTDRYVPYDMNWWKSEWNTTSVQTVAISGTPTGGTYTLTYAGASATETTTALAYNASAATVQAALRLLAGLDAVTVSSTGSTPDFTHTVVFNGVTGTAFTLTATSSLTGGSTPAVTIATGTSQPAVYLEVDPRFTSNSPATEELWMWHYAKLDDFTADTSTVDSTYAEWLAWEAILLHSVRMLQNKADTALWERRSQMARAAVLGWRAAYMPEEPLFVRHRRPG